MPIAPHTSDSFRKALSPLHSASALQTAALDGELKLGYCRRIDWYYPAGMKTITIKLPDFVNASLDAAAADQKKTKSAVVRDLLMQALPSQAAAAQRKPKRPSLHDRLKKYQDAGPTGIKDLASNPVHLEGYGR